MFKCTRSVCKANRILFEIKEVNMKNLNLKLDEENIKYILENNFINRNKYIASFLKLINGIKENKIIAQFNYKNCKIC